MRYLTFLIFAISLNADYYMAQFQPYRTVQVNAELSGVVEKVELSKEFSFISKWTEVMKLDTVFEDIQIALLKKRIWTIEEALKLRRENLENKKKVRSISQYEINNETLAVIETKSTLYTLQMELKLKEASRDKKSFFLKGRYFGEIFVEKGQFVGIGTPLFEYHDFSKGKLDIFVGADEVENIYKKRVFINGVERNDFKVEKLSSVKDSKRISTYRVRLIRNISNPTTVKFGEILRVEFKL